MNIETISCPLCANKNVDNFLRQENHITCKYCNTSFFVDVFEDFNTKLSNFFDEQKQEQIANVRFNLYTSVHEQFKSTEKILNYSRKLKVLSPEDFLATFYEIACSGNSHDINNFLNDISDFKNLKPFIQDIVEFMLESFEENNILPLKNLINNTFDNQEKIDYLTRLENESFKLNNGMYTSFLPRDVFVAYSSKDMKEVNQIVEYLENQEISCFVAVRNLRHGKGSVENYQNELKTAMNNCKCVVFVSSENSRSLGCDAFRIELKYIKENLPNMKRIEYVIQDYTSNTSPMVKNFLKIVFKDLEHCRTLDDLGNRVFDIVMNYDDTPTNQMEEQKNQLQDIISQLIQEKLDKNKIQDINSNISNQITETLNLNNQQNSQTQPINNDNNKNKPLLQNFQQPKDDTQKPNTILLEKETTIKTNQNEKVYTENGKFTDSNNGKKYDIIINFTETKEEIEKQIDKGLSYYKSKEYDKAIEIFEKYSNQYNPIAMAYLGDCYRDGNGITKDVHKAIDLYIKSSEQNCNHGIHRVGYCYELGIGFSSPDYTTAMCWYLRAANNGFAISQNNIGNLYYHGKGYTKDYKKAIEWYQKAADQNSNIAIYNLAYCYFNGNGVSIDYKKAFELFSKSADLNYPHGILMVGYFYDNGYYVQTDLKKAFELYLKSAELDCLPAMYNVGFFYEWGRGVKLDYAKAAEWYKKAADLGHKGSLAKINEPKFKIYYK
ncbi:MAG: toll/interleukin-1 receptor domain-containing protein [Clostridia bacterium]|nr:toll/interleukin-1 receptor domain-containing protein [Clostridia bacterium]